VAIINTLFNVGASPASVPITAHTFARKASIVEDGSGSAAGLVVTWPNGTVAKYAAGIVIVLGENPGGGAGGLVGIPAGAVQPAAGYLGASAGTQYCTVQSAGAATVVRLTEEN